MTTSDDFVERLAARLDSHADRPDRTDPGPVADSMAGSVAGSAAGSVAMTAIVEELRSPSTWAQPPAALRDQILSQVRAETAQPEAATPATDGGRARRTWWRSARTGRPRLWVLVPAAAMAAAVFTAGVIAIDRSLQPDLRPREVYTVAGTSLAPQAVVTASVADTPSGFSIWLRFSQLPAAAEGSYYAAWLVGPQGTVALGSFHERGASERVELWSGVDPGDYPTFIITLQAEGGPPGPSSLIVAQGHLTTP